jgi:hypothetical protein
MFIPRAMAYTPRQLRLAAITLDPAAGNLTIGQIVANLAGTLLNSIFFVSSAVFAYGALLYVLSAFKEENKNNGKEYMIGALVGLLVVLSAKLILGAVMLFIYGS